MTEAEHTEYINRQATAPRKQVKAPEPIQRAASKKTTRQAGPDFEEAQKKTLVIVLPFKLPTWNCLLAANPWKRKKIRDWIHAAILSCSADENDSQTQTVSVLKPRLTASSIAAYYEMITPKTSAKLSTTKSRPKRTKRSLR